MLDLCAGEGDRQRDPISVPNLLVWSFPSFRRIRTGTALHSLHRLSVSLSLGSSRRANKRETSDKCLAAKLRERREERSP